MANKLVLVSKCDLCGWDDSGTGEGVPASRCANPECDICMCEFCSVGEPKGYCSAECRDFVAEGLEWDRKLAERLGK